MDEILENDTIVEGIVAKDNREYSKPKNKKQNDKKEYKIRDNFKTKACKVINYDEKFKTLDVVFDGFGLRFNNVKSFTGDTAEVQYKGTIGKSDFEYSLKK